MTAPDTLTRSQIAQRIDELQAILDWSKITALPDWRAVMEKRLAELNDHLENRTRNRFNKGVVNPVPPDAIDYDNGAVVTPKPPEQIESEYNEWEKTLER
jgi:hypothetical protein